MPRQQKPRKLLFAQLFGQTKEDFYAVGRLPKKLPAWIKTTRLHGNDAEDHLPRQEVVSALSGDVDGDSDITDAGLGNNSFNQGANLWMHDSVHCIAGGTMCSVVSKDADAFVQQVNDFAGLINPESMRPVDLVAQANSGMSGVGQELFSLGSAVGLCRDGSALNWNRMGADTTIKAQTDDLVGIAIIV